MQPLLVLIHRINHRERLINIGNRGYQRCSLPYSPFSRFPVERISPTVVLVTLAAGLLKEFEEMDSALVISFRAREPGQVHKTHRVMGVSNRESLRLPEQSSY